MSIVAEEIEALFADFEDASRTQEWERFEHLFLPTFLSLDPTAAAAVERSALIAFLPRRRALFESAGASHTRLATLDITELDALHALARTTWTVVFHVPHGPVILRSTFTLRRTDDGWRIAVHLNHESLPELLGLSAPQR